MKKYLIASHGKFASGLKSSVQILTGKTQNITTIDAYLTDQEVDVGQKVDDFLKTIKAEDWGIIFTDLVGGSVNREVLLRTNQQSNIFVITSVNLPTVLSIMLDIAQPTKEHLQNLINEAPVQLSELDKQNINELSEDEFLL
ncbi:PTS sugar transporter subunit IIA [Bombilactobacillus bombi]|uniref:PTS sugar transporter subunit IIA n=1 Tax=Bombilactobacillus bombi TaxID=1303590 RepID=UPI000E57C189|nr:PTS sugar transporter subunit IIA [Bombilactobacillus bombi]AXX65550.1 PTS sugar transporter subunit IIA [Bombilactobacillus bombi]